MPPADSQPPDLPAKPPGSPEPRHGLPLDKLAAPVQRVVVRARQARSMLERTNRALRYLWLKLVRQKGTPEHLAMGVAVGVFIGLVVPPMLQLVVALALAFPLRYSRVGAVLGTLVTNPLTMPFIYPAEALLGIWLTGIEIQLRIPEDRQGWLDLLTNWHLHGRALLVLAVGALVAGVAASVPSYYLTKRAIVAYRHRREQRLLARQQRLAQRLAEEQALRGDRPPAPPSGAPDA